ncbi:hypothetical protein [Sediminicola luteus]|uniref:hypothetical protein n=1 Tax=Sediminicola luteus TaxID=319238 RepID=UPI001144C8EB|nr:hypothetical protein [Sediminicola luteus]
MQKPNSQKCLIRSVFGLVILAFVIVSCKKEEKLLPSTYLDLVFYHKNDSARTFSHCYFKLREVDDNFGDFIQQHPNRFIYLASHYSKREDFVKLYPDTLRIRELLKDYINDQPFRSTFSLLAMQDMSEGNKFSWEEVMQVASRFFEVVGVKGKYRLKICTGNDFSGLEIKGNRALLEAMVYEALATERERAKPSNADFVENARTYFSEALKSMESKQSGMETINVKNEVYSQMAQDKALKKYLHHYFSNETNSIPITLIDD